MLTSLFPSSVTWDNLLSHAKALVSFVLSRDNSNAYLIGFRDQMRLHSMLRKVFRDLRHNGHSQVMMKMLHISCKTEELKVPWGPYCMYQCWLYNPIVCDITRRFPYEQAVNGLGNAHRWAAEDLWCSWNCRQLGVCMLRWRISMLPFIALWPYQV